MSEPEGEGKSQCPSCHEPLAAGAVDCPKCLWSALKLKSLAELEVDPTQAMRLSSILRGVPPGRIVGGAQLIEQIGHGGMGVVWRARALAPVREVALKMMKGEGDETGEFRARFELEARALAVLDHPAILPLYDYGEDDGCAWFTMKLASGGNLAMRRDKYIGQWRMTAELVSKLAKALQYAHDRGVLHRDMKPANVLFDDKGEAYIADFGLAKLVGESSVLEGSMAVLGTPAYLSPEIAAADARAATTASDVYGLGATFYELLTGNPPYVAKSLHAMLKEITSADPISPARQLSISKATHTAVPRDLDVICMKCLARDPAKRYGSARELAEDLDRWLEGRPILARHTSVAERVWSWAKRNPAVASLASALVLALISGGVLLFLKNQELRGALVSAKEARNDAEKRIEFMTRDLGGKMQSFGQLTLLNEVFADVARYYDSRPADASDAAAVERRITFLLKAGEILMPQGKLDDAVVKFNEAIRAAELAAKLHPQESRFRVLQLQGYKLAGQALMESKGNQEALKMMREGLAKFGQTKESGEMAERAGLLTVAARSTSRLASEFKDNESVSSQTATDAVRFADEAVTLCRGLVSVNSTPDSHAGLATALEGLGVVLKEQAERLKKKNEKDGTVDQFYERSLDAFQEMHDLCVMASKAVEDNLLWQRRVGQADNWMAAVQRKQKNFAAAKANLAKQRAIMEPLLVAEPLNGEWQMSMVLNAWAEGQIAEEEHNEAAAKQWHEKQVEISSRLMNQNPSVRTWWIHHQQALRDLYQDLKSTDRDHALVALRRSAEAAVRANELHAPSKEFEVMMTGVVQPALGDLKTDQPSDVAIAFADRMASRFERAANLPGIKEPLNWLKGALQLRMQLEMLHRLAGHGAAADEAFAAAQAIWKKAMVYPGALGEVGHMVRAQARVQTIRAFQSADVDQMLAAAGRWVSLTGTLPATSISSGWRAGWFRFLAEIGEAIRDQMPNALPQARELCRAWLGKLSTATPSLPLDAAEQDAIKSIKRVLED